MMNFSLVSIVVLVALLILCCTFVQGLRRNIAVARSTGLRYVIVPFHITSVPWMLLQPIVLPILDRLPASWTRQWLL